MKYWLLKSEPDTFSIDDLINRPDQIEPWDGVRNYQARNIMREMTIGDLAFFYHSNAGKNTGIVGIIKIVKTSYVDDSQFDVNSAYYDPKAMEGKPRWERVDVQFIEKFDAPILLSKLKTVEDLSTCLLLKKGNRLSVMQIESAHWNAIIQLK